jgi:hypothetical protein
MKLIEHPGQPGAVPRGTITRRDLLMKTLFGAGLVGLRALATGLPISFLTNPRKALAGSPPSACAPGSNNAQYLILATSGNGDPINANVPGTYGISGVVHPDTLGNANMAATNFSLNGVQTTAALPWTQLPASVLAHTCFFHHGTYTLIHPDEPNVLALMGATTNNEMFCSMVSQQLATCLGSAQAQPVALGQESIMYQGQPLPLLPPSALAATLTAPGGPLTQLQAIRDQSLDALNALVRAEGNSAQQAFIDNYSLSQTQVRSLSQTLMSQLATIPDNTPPSQLQAASILIQMNVAPVIVVHLDFGGDNHFDQNLTAESTQTVATLQNVGQFMSSLPAGYENRVSMAMMNVFGRTLSASYNATTNGRGHNENHHCTVMIGSPFAGSIIGGVEAAAKGGTDYTAQSIDSSTGAGVPGGAGNIPFTETFASAAVTLGAGLGVDPTYLSKNVSGGTVVNSAFA